MKKFEMYNNKFVFNKSGLYSRLSTTAFAGVI